MSMWRKSVFGYGMYNKGKDQVFHGQEPPIEKSTTSVRKIN